MESVEARDKAYESNGVLFDNKLFVIKPWRLEMPTDKNSLSTMSIWIQLPKLKMEYWGETSLRKIAVLVGNGIKLNQTTSQKARLRFARVLVELTTNEEYPEEIHFTNVNDELITPKVTYEYKLVLCNKCKKVGHYEQNCHAGGNETRQKTEER